MKIVEISYSDTKEYWKQAKLEHVSFRDSNESKWYGIYDKGILVSFYCLEIRGQTARFRSNYTVRYFRRRGCLQEFIEHAKSICQANNLRYMTCFCTNDSLNSHLRQGAELMSKNRFWFVRYSLGQK